MLTSSIRFPPKRTRDKTKSFPFTLSSQHYTAIHVANARNTQAALSSRSKLGTLTMLAHVFLEITKVMLKETPRNVQHSSLMTGTVQVNL